MFAHAISSTNATAPSSASRPGLMSPTTRSCSGVSMKPTFSLYSRIVWLASCFARADAAACARTCDNPAGSRATARSVIASRDGFARVDA